MDTDTFDHFLALAETLSLTKTAEKLGKSESVISRQISRFEGELGFKLFERNRNGFTLTGAGEVMQKTILNNRTNYDTAVQKGRSLSQGHEAVINIGFLNSHLFPERVREMFMEFQKEHPNYHIHLTSHSIKPLVEYLGSGKLDFVFGAPIDFDGKGIFESIPMEKIAHCLLLYPGHPMLSRKPEELTISDFADDTFLVVEGHSDVYKNITRLGQRYNFHPKIREVEDYSVLISMMQFGQGISFEDSTCFYYTAGGFVPIELPDLGAIPLGLIGKKGNADPACAVLTEFARKYELKE